MTVGAAKERPVNLVLSGPAGGVVGASAFSELVGAPDLITLDMGGTSLDAAIIIGGQPAVTTAATFQGLPVSLPTLDINTIGAGGGSIGWVDAGDHLQVGPQSAGADPGPASYGRGGIQPTVTDAALASGYLGSDTALGGELTLDRDLAARSMEAIAAQMGMSGDDVAAGMLRIATTKVVGAVREITVERGHSPADFAILSFGGAGGIIASDTARELGVPRVIVPPGPGAFSAMGMLMADVAHDFARTRITDLADVDAEGLEADYRELGIAGRNPRSRAMASPRPIAPSPERLTSATRARSTPSPSPSQPASSTRPWPRTCEKRSGWPMRPSTDIAPGTRSRS